MTSDPDLKVTTFWTLNILEIYWRTLTGNRALFVDFTKAFDRVDHNILLKIQGPWGNTLPRQMVPLLPKISVSDCTRRQSILWLYITAGMPQGSPLGLLSFLLLIDCLTHKYMDDTHINRNLAVHSKLITCTLSFSSCRPVPPQTKWTYTLQKPRVLGPLAKSPFNCYLSILTTLSAWKDYSISRHYSLAWYEFASSHWRDNHEGF